MVDPAEATGKTKEMFEAIQSKLGMVPNMMRGMAASPAVLEGYLGLSNALSHGQLRPTLREEIALDVAEYNGCNYCLSAHTAIGGMLKLSQEEMLAARQGKSADPKTGAALVFARALVEKRGSVSHDDLTAVRAAGYSDGEIAEIVAHVAINVLTNYFNIAAETEIDFPKVEAFTR